MFTNEQIFEGALTNKLANIGFYSYFLGIVQFSSHFYSRKVVATNPFTLYTDTITSRTSAHHRAD